VAKTDDDRPPPPRRFERREGGSETFWTAVLDGSALTVTYGKIGKAGRTRTKTFPGPELARQALDEQVAERLAKGYVEIRTTRAVDAGRWDLPETWQEVYDRIDVQYSRWGKPAPKPTQEQIDAFEAAYSFKLPPSYRAFLQVFGAGEVNFMFRIAAPGGPEHYNLEAMNAEARGLVTYHGYDFVTDEYAGLEPITRMVIFCEWDSDRWGWDPQEQRDPGRGEYAIRHWGRSGSRAEVVASSFPEFINDVLMRDSLNWFGREPEPGFTPATRDEAKRTRKPTSKPTAPGATPRPKRRSAKEENEHLHRIVADPGDEAAQLAYADWLDRYGDPQADLIRLRCELARLAEDDPRRESLEARERELLAEHAKAWSESLVGAGTLIAALKRLGAAVGLDAQGRVREVQLEEPQVTVPCIEHLGRCPALRSFHIDNRTLPLAPEVVRAIGRLPQLEELSLYRTQLTDDLLEHLAAHKDLRVLLLRNNLIRGDGLAHLREMTRLKTLYLWTLYYKYDGPPGGRVGSEGQDEPRPSGCLVHLKDMTELETLTLEGNHFTGEGLLFLGGMTRLRALDLSQNEIRDDDLKHLSGLKALTYLNLERTRITGAGLEHLQGLTSLERLQARYLPIGDTGAAWIGSMASLTDLDLGNFSDGRITDAGAACLKGLSRLVRLDLSYQRLTDKALAHLSRLENLEELKLYGNEKIRDPGLEHLKDLPKLRRLDLGGTNVSNASAPLLKTFTHLESLGLHCTKVNERGIKQLQKALPNAGVY
jgi:internalin A